MDLNQYKDFMSQFPTGVAVATSTDKDLEPVGMTVSSFVSISLHPMVVMISVNKSFALASAIEYSKAYAVNILSSSQQAIGVAFADKTVKMHRRFELAGYKPHANADSPVLTTSLASMTTKVTEQKSVGDHILFFGEVSSCIKHSDAMPMVYWNRQWAKLA